MLCVGGAVNGGTGATSNWDGKVDCTSGELSAAWKRCRMCCWLLVLIIAYYYEMMQYGVQIFHVHLLIIIELIIINKIRN